VDQLNTHRRGDVVTPVIACIEIGGSGTQTVVFADHTPRFVDGAVAPRGALVGVASPGIVVDGRVVASSTFGWADVDPMSQLGLDGPATLVCNDAEAAALGEWVLRGRLDAALVYVGIGTGIGGAVVIDGSVASGNLFGHQSGFGSKQCTCGRRGCLETMAAGWAMPDPLDEMALGQAARAVARAIAAEPSAAHGVVVIGGGIADRYPALIARIHAELTDRQVVRSSRPAAAKSAAPWGVHELVVRNAVAAVGQVDVRVGGDASWCASTAAGVIEREVARRPDLVLGVATGATPLATYYELARRRVDLSNAWIYLLDEYIGLPAGDPRSYIATIRALFCEQMGVDPHRVRAPDTSAIDLVDASRRYDAEIDARGGVTLQIMGIGRNGHIGFNEPGTRLDSVTRPVDLSATTRHDNARFFTSPDDVPRSAITRGVASIVNSGSLLMIATGTAKERALTAALIGPISSAVPASAIRLRGNALVVADSAAGAGVVAARALVASVR
jgi:glucosamine-6-phosphate deaminase